MDLESKCNADVAVKDKIELKKEQPATENKPDKQEEQQQQIDVTVPKKTILQEYGYNIGKQIGTGSYAKVKIAFSDEHQCKVAIKIIKKYNAPEDILTKFVPREISVVKGLRHENLIRFYQSIETTHRYYIIMEFAENGSILELLRKCGNLSETKAKDYYKQILSALQYIHKVGVAHRDIKCENLLLDRNDKLKLIDFGFARSIKSSTTNCVLSETYCGSYAYACIEILKGIPYDPQLSDTWASGVVLFAMIFGRLPYDDSNYRKLIKQVQAKLTIPSEPAVSVECKTLISKILGPSWNRLSIPKIMEDSWFTTNNIASTSQQNDK